MHDEDFRRPNTLALLSLLGGLLTLLGQGLCLYLWLCTPFFLAPPTILTLGLGWLGFKQSQRTGVGELEAVLGLTLGGINLLIGLFWLALLCLLGLLSMAIWVATL